MGRDACEAHALHTRGSRLRRFAPNREEKTTVLQSMRGRDAREQLARTFLGAQLNASYCCHGNMFSKINMI